MYRNSDQSTYDNYANMLMNMNYGYTTYSDSNRMNYQSAMRNIRTKWESQGYSFFKSEWEDWGGAKR